MKVLKAEKGGYGEVEKEGLLGENVIRVRLDQLDADRLVGGGLFAWWLMIGQGCQPNAMYCD